MPPLYYVARGLTKLLFWLLTRWQIKGQENVPEKGPLIVVANHLHNADPPLIAASLHRDIVFMAKEELFHSWWRLAIKGVGAFPVRRGGVDRTALHQAIQILREGKILGIFPEGTRSRNGRLQTARRGVSLIAYHSQTPLLPVGVSGTEKIVGAFWWLRRPRVTVTIGKPFTLAPNHNDAVRETLASFTGAIMGHIAELLPPEYRGVYSQGTPAHLGVASVTPVVSRGQKGGS